MVGYRQDGAGHVAEVCFLDDAFGGQAGLGEIRDNAVDQRLTLAICAVHLDPAEPADREFVHVQHDHLVVGMYHVSGHLDGRRHMLRQLVTRCVYGQYNRLTYFFPPSPPSSGAGLARFFNGWRWQASEPPDRPVGPKVCCGFSSLVRD
ncbi:MAG TPA: hypothetical protein VMA72_27115 [Streptosporangiaceae bacterium]|nr:hypothetical protein [Streptosporangiaceae bacterium]